MVEPLVSTRRHDGDAVLVEVRGPLDDSAVVSQLRRTLADMILHRPAGRVLLDLAYVTDIDGVGIGTVVAGCDALGDVGISVLVCGRANILTDLRASGLATTHLQDAPPAPI